MRIELMTLAASVLLGLVSILLATNAATRQRGIRWNLGARDEKKPELTGVAGRLDRASKNFFETFPLYITATMLVHITDRYSIFTMIGCQLYFWARVIYLPLYAAGFPIVRTLVWGVSLLGILMLLASPFM